MKIDKDRLLYLLQQYMADTISEEELFELGRYDEDTDVQSELPKIIDDLWSKLDIDDSYDLPKGELYQRIIGDSRVQQDLLRPKMRKTVAFRVMNRYRVAGIAALLCIAIGLFWYVNSNMGNQVDSFAAKLEVNLETKQKQSPILPGGNKAMLTLASGKTIVLDEVKTGSVVEEAGMRITKISDGKLIYEDLGSNLSKGEVFNIITTPVGGEYQLMLADGTKVWLNAASSLHFPARFNGSVREVELVGEAYFEVNNQKTSIGQRVPFIVTTVSQKVQVLGTHFNIKAYPSDDVVKTTLVEGSIRVSIHRDENGDNRMLQPMKASMLKPNQQATSSLNSDVIDVKDVNPINAIAWKNGYFSFQDDSIEDIMTAISRWYNIEVEYRNKTDDKTFGGTISRFETIEKLLKTIELTGSVKFIIEGRRVIVVI